LNAPAVGSAPHPVTLEPDEIASRALEFPSS
jgi:hypothetical protein